MLTRCASLLGLLVSVWTFACTTGGDSGEDSDTAADTTSTSESGGEPFVCGDIECAADQACLTFPQEPMCENKLEDQPCPEGTTETACGGAGIPCCCGPTPPTIYECTATTDCGELVDCTCLADVCTPECTTTVDPRVFFCDEPPAP